MKGRATGRDGARPLQGIGAGLWRRGAPRVWLPPAKFQNGIWGVSHGHPALRKQRWWCAVKGRCGHRPLRRDGEVSATTRASGAQRSGCASGWEDGVGIGAGIIPKGASNAGQSLRHGCAVTAPFAQGSLGDGDADCRVGPLDLLAMTTAFCHSEERSDVGIRLFYDGRGFGPPRSSAPTEGLPKSQQWADVGIGPYGKPNQPPKPAGAQRSVRARGREGWAGIGAKTIPKEGPLPRPPGQRLAKRKARKEELVKFGFCPMTSECSTAHQVRKSQQSPARALVGAAVTE